MMPITPNITIYKFYGKKVKIAKFFENCKYFKIVPQIFQLLDEIFVKF